MAQRCCHLGGFIHNPTLPWISNRALGDADMREQEGSYIIECLFKAREVSGEVQLYRNLDGFLMLSTYKLRTEQSLSMTLLSHNLEHETFSLQLSARKLG